jgi:arylsulfatase A-like enzyme
MRRVWMLVAWMGFSGCGPSAEPPPNVVLISIDTLRHDFVGFGGAPEGTTPTLDRLARQGVVFANALSTAS